ncbi:glycine, alanine and asparagine-rich protein-like [Gossypium australe]|uniref:Glycine, alanine and asparagine-rich protein-like n=1 Tax=Gossypium australe TaxID=47621 RepID=A0A5B6VK56_9ROSI|nr:glycine, alanine and asparagine-rich protein-like [Gossypium australe]
MGSSLGSYPSYTWKSTWAAKGLLQMGLGWRHSPLRRIGVYGEENQRESSRSEVGTIFCYKNQIFCNYIPNFYNLYNRRLVGSLVFPKCSNGPESLELSFCDCFTAKEVWEELNIHWPQEISDFLFQDWLYYMFFTFSNRVCKVMELVRKIQAYIKEIDALRLKAPFLKPCLGIVVRNLRGYVIVSTTIINQNIPTGFTVEALACLQVVCLAIDLGFQDVLVEGDAPTVVKKLQNNSPDSSCISAYITNLKDLSKNFRKCL